MAKRAALKGVGNDLGGYIITRIVNLVLDEASASLTGEEGKKEKKRAQSSCKGNGYVYYPSFVHGWVCREIKGVGVCPATPVHISDRTEPCISPP